MTEFALSATEFDVVWRGLGYGLPPLILDVPSPGATYTERAVIEREVWDALGGRGLADGPGQPRPAVAALFAVIAERKKAIELRVGALRTVLAVGPRRAVLAQLDGDRMWFATVPETGLAATIVEVLPAAPAGAGRSVTVDARALAAAEAASTPIARQKALQDSGVARGDARALAEMTDGATEVGQFAVEVDGRRGDRVVAFYRGTTGRYQLIRHGDHITVTPASAAQLSAAVDRLLEDFDRQLVQR
ncbi:ESX secretion-associated protein EspG [Labedaea rhizosphaerae]|uniref:ESAT-6 protein secretion system EspG family protein n=1 Tax=Labedaea rhizosphaerae TaxID=598644 RepID=A0A4R6SP70_LABRH|nr:ESX secretion-associated protein EspG [Labedaea rhizosphaerae]TDQ05242.1 ESAT-6 protein secretion system EspG family protein [Labedaea rhizosphaerae]